MDARDDWAQIKFSSVALRSTDKSNTSKKLVDIKAAIYAKHLYIFASWKDSKPGREHKPYIWDEKKSRYITGPEREDRLALQFEIEGQYTANWPEATYFKADMWHWKSTRSAPLDLMHDKYTVVSNKKMTRSRKLVIDNNKPIYVKRISDSGDKLYSTQRYGKFNGHKKPKYILNKNISGSTSDVKAKSRWHKDKWQLEIKRLLDTGHDDDVKFILGKNIRAGISVFNDSDDDIHFVSETLEFNF